MKKILFSGHASLFPTEHGGAKSVRHAAESLAAAGAQCLVLVKLHPAAPERIRFAGQRIEDLRANKEIRDLRVAMDGSCTWSFAGVSYAGVPGSSSDLAAATRRELKSFDPDSVVLCDDSLEEGLELYQTGADSGKLVFLAQTIHSLPFGPFAMKPSAPVTEAIQRAKVITAPSRHVAEYIQTHLGRAAFVRYPDVFGRGPFPSLGRLENPFVTMINPCPWKGSSILLNLARKRPDLQFAAVPTWGATPPLIEELKSVPNITLLAETPRIDEIFEKTRVLLVPSMCQEAFGLVSPEAMLRGIPVVAGDIAGLRESTLGVAKLIPVTPLPFEGPKEGSDHTKFEWKEPNNPVEPWSRAIDELLNDPNRYRYISERGRNAALRFIETLSARSPFENLFPEDSRSLAGTAVAMFD